MKKINFENGKTKVNAETFNTFQDNIEEASVPGGGTTGQVLVKKSNLDNETEWADQVGGGSATGDTLPIGSMVPYLKAVPPENWLTCDGSAISRADYPELFNAIGTTFGEGDGSTTFNLPNSKGRTIVGLDAEDTDFNAIGKTLGEKTHTLTTNELPKHGHITGEQHYGISASSGTDSATVTYTKNGSLTGLTGDDQPHNNIQPSIVITYIIKAKQSAGVVATVVDSLESTSATDALSAKKGKALNDKIMPTVLYMSDGNTVKSDITLNDNVSNYDYLDIQFKKASGGGVTVGYSRIYKENYGMYNALTSSFSSGDNKVITIYSCIISLATNKITINNGNSIAIKETGIGGFSNSNELAILSVRGYKIKGGSDAV